MSNPNSLFSFADNNIYLCGTVIQELDKHKKDPGERGYNARESLRLIANLIKDAIENETDKEQRLKIVRDIGIDLGNGGRLFFEPDGVDIANLPKGYDITVPDNRIISSCVHMNKNYLKDSPVTLLTNDGGCFINSLVCGVNADNVKSEEIEYIGYSGHLDLEIADWNIINKIHEDLQIEASEIPEIGKLDYPLYENQFVTITCGNMCVLTVYQKGIIKKIEDIVVHDNIHPLNKMQTYAMWALTNPDIPLVILEGPAGTSKTFASLACGLHQLGVGNRRAAHEIYDRVLISRPNAKTSDGDFGYLPGTLEEKMGPLVASYMDNLEVILGDKETPIKETRAIIEDMMLDRFIELCPLYSIRGRSINNAYLICDEAQNASKKLIKDVVTRPCQNTKVIIAGDPSQVDNMSLDKRNNGLVYAKDCMKGSPLCAIIRFEPDHCVRSPLAEEAINRMK
jgi:PhoH-like ATPase